MNHLDKNVCYFFYFLVLVTTSVPFFIKHFGQAFLIPYGVYVLAAIFITWLVNYTKGNRYSFIDKYNIWLIFVILVAAINAYAYKKTTMALNPSTAPMALIEPAQAFFNSGLNPYSVSLLGGAPISPGPGWILLNALLTVNGLIPLLMPAYFTVANIFVAKSGKQSAFVFSLMLILSLNFIQFSAVGHDLPAVSLAFVALTLALNLYYANRKIFLLIAVLTGLIATARIPLIVVPLAMGVCLTTINRTKGLQFFGVSTFIAILTHAVFYIWSVSEDRFYQPMHVFGRASSSVPIELLGFGGFVWVVLIVALRKRLTKSVSSWLVFMWFLLAVPFIGIGLAELVRDNIFSLESWARWEGKGYVMFTLPLLIAGLVLDGAERKAVGIPPPSGSHLRC